MSTKIAALALLLAACGAALSWTTLADQGPPPPLARRALLRRPVAAAFLGDRPILCVANQRSGSVALVDVSRARLLGEWVVGQHLTDLAVLPDRKHVLVVDDQRHELLVLAADATGLVVRTRLAVGPYPVRVSVLPDGKRAAVASLWSRRIEVVDLTPLDVPGKPLPPRVLHVIRLPFAPRSQCVLPGASCMVVADAFGGHLAVVDLAAGQLVSVHELNGHNLNGMALGAGGR